jgi:hypothetical protein
MYFWGTQGAWGAWGGYFSNKKELNIKKYFKGFRPGRTTSKNLEKL